MKLSSHHSIYEFGNVYHFAELDDNHVHMRVVPFGGGSIDLHFEYNEIKPFIKTLKCMQKQFFGVKQKVFNGMLLTGIRAEDVVHVKLPGKGRYFDLDKMDIPDLVNILRDYEKNIAQNIEIQRDDEQKISHSSLQIG